MASGIRHRFLTGADLHEPKGVESAPAGSVYVASGTGTGIWANLLTGLRNANRMSLSSRFADISTPQSVFIPCPLSSRISKVMICLQGAITTADTTVTVKINGILVQGSTILIPFASAAAGAVYVCTPTGANSVPVNNAIEIITDGASSGTVAAEILVYLNTE